jgi:hypothetical protein
MPKNTSELVGRASLDLAALGLKGHCRILQSILLSQFRHGEPDGYRAEARRAATPMDGIVGSNVGRTLLHKPNNQ